MPLRFELDTRDLPNGAHVLKIEVFDRGGSLAVSPEVRVVIDNSTPRPRTTPAAPSLGAGKLVNKPAPATGKPVTPPAAPASAPAATAANSKTTPTAAAPAPNVAPGTKATPAKVATDTPTAKSAGTAVATSPAPATGTVKPATSTAPKPTQVALGAGTTVTPQGRTLTVTVNGPLPKAGAPGAKASPAATPREAQLLAVPLTPGATVNRPVSVLLDGRAMTFTPEPYIVNGHTMVVLRALLADSGSPVRWDNIAKQATAIVGNNRYLLTPDQRIVLRDGEVITLTEPVTLTAGRLFIPVTAWRDLFGGSVAYHPDTRQVVLSAPSRVQAKLAP
jgi:hypothetical protein